MLSLTVTRRRVAAIAAVLAVGLAAVGCGGAPGDATDGANGARPGGTNGVTTTVALGGTILAGGSALPALPPPSTVAPPSTDAEAPGGCGTPADGYEPVGADRRVLVRGVPAAAAPTAAVVVLHGYTGTPEHIENNSGWTPFLRARGVLVAYPEGTKVAPGGFGWNTGTHRFSTSGVDDLAYLAAVVQLLVRAHCVDPGRIMLTGESNGGALTLLAACDGRTRPLFSFFAPVIPAIDAGALERCAAGPPIPFVALASRRDQTVPYDGVYPGGQVPMLAQELWFAAVAVGRDGCTLPFVRTPIDDGEVITPQGCADAPTLVAVDDGAHTWPGGTRAPGGPPTGRFPANEYLWSRAHLG